MKFSKELEGDWVPEWRVKYLDYKQGKKKLKALDKALRKVSKPPRRKSRRDTQASLENGTAAAALENEAGAVNERSPLHLSGETREDARPQMRRYGSIMESLTQTSSQAFDRLSRRRTNVSSLELPNPALNPSFNPSSYGDGDLGNDGSDNPLRRRATESFQMRSLESYRELDFRKADFFLFLDRELAKIQSFYHEKEEEAKERLKALEQQLRILDQLKNGETGANGSTQLPHAQDNAPEAAIDMEYVRRYRREFSYRSARRKLRHAFVDYHRSLELLQRYAVLNQKAFRKITKKHDKTTASQSGAKFYRERVTQAFSEYDETVQGLTEKAVEMFAQLMGLGTAQARALMPTNRHVEAAAAFIRDGLFAGSLLALGFAFGIEGVIEGFKQATGEGEEAELAAVLLQLYAGFFLVIFFALLFCCLSSFWKNRQINYEKIFDLRRSHALLPIELLELTSIFLLYLGATINTNFKWDGPDSPLYPHWPLILLVVSAITMALPYKVAYRNSRMWFLRTMLRVFSAGIVEVEFRDLFIGDVFCSMTYVFGNAWLLLCSYSYGWNNTSQCGSGNSAVFGLFTTLPAVIRAFQCLRRWYESDQNFPNLYNFGKYCCTILQYSTLSIYRIDQTSVTLVIFIFFSAINTLYVIVWDIGIDWSLGDPKADMPFLRNERLFKQVELYYTSIILDVLLRCSWILYVIFTNDVEHSAIISFIISFTEVGRRGGWALLRLENEQRSENKKLNAARAPELPFPPPSPQLSARSIDMARDAAHTQDHVRREQDSDVEDDVSLDGIDDGQGEGSATA